MSLDLPQYYLAYVESSCRIMENNKSIKDLKLRHDGYEYINTMLFVGR
jgi:hypothetical protein